LLRLSVLLLFSQRVELCLFFVELFRVALQQSPFFRATFNAFMFSRSRPWSAKIWSIAFCSSLIVPSKSATTFFLRRDCS